MKLDTRFFGKFSKLTDTLGNNTPLSDCTRLWRCIQGHLNFHMSSTSITIHGIDNLDTAETLRNSANGSAIARLSLQDMLYRFQLENKAPLLLQLSQRASGQVDAVIPNTPEAELLAKKMNVQIATWCHFYWKSMNPGGERFHKKLSNRTFNQVMLHKIGKCEWDGKTMTVSSPTLRSELSEVIKFKNQDWVKNLAQASSSPPKKYFVDPKAAFPFPDDFSVGTIHRANLKAPSREQGVDESDVIKIVDANNDVSALMTKTRDELLTLLL
jgi:hypothetical protein